MRDGYLTNEEGRAHGHGVVIVAPLRNGFHVEIRGHTRRPKLSAAVEVPSDKPRTTFCADQEQLLLPVIEHVHNALVFHAFHAYPRTPCSRYRMGPK